ncbi:hypothetical protein, partial [Roseicitreum antarcticum]
FDGTITMITGIWGETITAADLPGRIEFYEKLAARSHPRTGESRYWASTYEPKVAALRRAQKIHDKMFSTEREDA